MKLFDTIDKKTSFDIGTKIQFSKKEDIFFNDLKQSVAQYFSDNNLSRFATRGIWVKMIFFMTLYWGLYALLLLVPMPNFIVWVIVATYVAYNICHDAAHETFSSNKTINNIIYYFSFNMLGTNAYLWKIRHKHAHHVFPNVPGCDVDIEGNNIMRLGPHTKWQPKFKYQILYGAILYCVYTLYWVFIKDFVIFSWSELANMKNIKLSLNQAVLLIVNKILYFTYMLFIPYMVLELSFGAIFFGFVTMHVSLSLWMALTLFSSHLAMETQFPIPDKNGVINHTYSQHQLLTALDYHPTSKIANFFFGGFNSHAAHHLFPQYCSIHYCDISKIIEQKTSEYGITYNKTTLFNSFKSHLKYLWYMGQEPDLVGVGNHQQSALKKSNVTEGVLLG